MVKSLEIHLPGAPRMDWKTLFLSPEGRMGIKDFWLGFLILFGLWWVLNLVPLVGHLVQLAMIYSYVCLYAKRLHDMGRSGFWQLIPMAVTAVCLTVGVTAAGAGIAAAVIQGDTEAVLAAVAGGFLLLGLCALAGIVCLIFLTWVGVAGGQPGTNRYGPPPARSLFDAPPAGSNTPPAGGDPPPMAPAG